VNRGRLAVGLVVGYRSTSSGRPQAPATEVLVKSKTIIFERCANLMKNCWLFYWLSFCLWPMVESCCRRHHT